MERRRIVRILSWLTAAALTALCLLFAAWQLRPWPLEPRGSCRYYLDGVWLEQGERPRGVRRDYDCRCVAERSKELVYYNYPEGYRLTLPKDTEFDLTHGNVVTELRSKEFALTVSREWSPYKDVDGYLQFYQNRFYENEGFRESNGLILLEDETIETAGRPTRLLTLSFSGDCALEDSVYTFAYQKVGRSYLRYLFRGTEFNEAYTEACRKVLQSFQTIPPKGRAKSTLHPEPKADPRWSAETAALWQRYREQKGVDWGIFVADMFGGGLRETVPALEEKIGRPFEVVLLYLQLGYPLDGPTLELARERGKIIELTLQVSAENNTEIYGYTPMFDLLTGRFDEDLRQLAGQLKDFEHPVLFRLNNEMNSDWTSYSGIVTLSDPEIYIAVWRYVYDFFRDEGVDNLIWVFNPNDHNYPPSNWNHFTRYWPGDDYVQMIGLTGYNTGDYYADLTGETWREFSEIYTDVEENYRPYFGDYPWMITEFGCSSYGGDKVKWIEEMFGCIDDFENLKVAVWWSYADFDTREGKEGIAARPYYLDETEETLQAFAAGRNAQP
ncbi:MAG: hypothetical protein IJL39_02190 [Clostridia bacterium]|nr:hypothetical protein [Clostridia bacterium]